MKIERSFNYNTIPWAETFDKPGHIFYNATGSFPTAMLKNVRESPKFAKDLKTIGNGLARTPTPKPKAWTDLRIMVREMP